MYKISLPKYVFEDGLKGLVTSLGKGNNESELLIDFSNVTFYTPAAIIALITKFYGWVGDKKTVKITGHKRCPAYAYLQRIDFFNKCGIPLEENFERQEATGRFVELSDISSDVTKLSTKIATCIAPDQACLDDATQTGFFDCLEYAISELGNNVRQHSQGKGFCCAQYFESKDITRIAIADCGIGIRESFNNTPYWKADMSDLDAIKLAVQTEVSSKTHLSIWGESPNAGVGLSLLKSISQNLRGNFTVISGSAFFSQNIGYEIPKDYDFQGTLCAFTFKRAAVNDFFDLLLKIKTDLGLIKNINQFDGMFS